MEILESFHKAWQIASNPLFAGAFLCICAMSVIASRHQPFSEKPELPQQQSEVPPLPLPEEGRKVHVETAEELKKAISEIQDGDTILLADGVYKVGRFLRLDKVKNVQIRSVSGDPTKVTLRGRDFDTVDSSDDILRIAGCENITIAYLTFQDCHTYALKVEAEHSPRNIQIYNCYFRDFGRRAIKGSGTKNLSRKAANGSIRYCYFENTKTPHEDWLYGGSYVSGIDMMALENWTISDNTFRNINGAKGGGRAAIFIWVRSSNVTVERNVIVNCDRGIAFGNPSSSTNFIEGMWHISDSICRNNFIAGGSDSGIELAWVRDSKVYHNTVWRQDPDSRGIRCIKHGAGVENVIIANNLVRGDIALTGSETARNNKSGELTGYFQDPDSGDLHLRPEAEGAIGKGVLLPEVTEDIDGQPRSETPDLGADEFNN